jgi:hypothetical protein
MIAVLLALILAILNGATDVRTPQTGFGARQDDRTVILEFVAPHCPTWDEPCYVVVDQQTLRWEVGP